MSLDFMLMPDAIRAQSRGALQKLRTDNEAYRQAKRTLESFSCDATIRSVAFDALKEKLSDYMLIAESLIAANDSDIFDYIILNGEVGSINLIGSTIALNQRFFRDRIEWAEGRMEMYRRLQMEHVPANMVLFQEYDRMRRMFRDIRDVAQDGLQYWEDREQLYRDIEQTTRSLFTDSVRTRELIRTGLDLIAKAAVGLPSSYGHADLASWRGDMNNNLEDVRARHGIAVNRISEMLRYGEVSINALIGDPVNAATGNYVYKHKDLEILGHLPLQFQRFYNSLNHRCGSLGRGWSHNYEISLSYEKDGVLIFFGEDGHSEYYKQSAPDTYESDENNKYAQLTKTEEGIYLLKRSDCTLYQFSRENQIETITDRQGKAIHFEYEKDGLTLSKVHTISGSLTFLYEKSRIMAVKDHSGRQICFVYDNGLLTEYKNPMGDAYHYDYDEYARLHQVKNPEGHVTVQTIFDDKDRATVQVFPDGSAMEYLYDAYGKEMTFVQGNGNQVVYKKNYKGETNQILYADGSEEEFLFANGKKTVQWDRMERRIFSAKYDDRGNATTLKNALDVKTELEYTEDNQLNKVTLAGQEKIKNTYDAAGNLRFIEDAKQNKTALEYKEKGLIEKIILPDNGEISIAYDGQKNISKVIDACGVAMEYKYDGLNRVICTIDGNQKETHYAYDQQDNLVALTNALGDTQKFTYNKNNKVIAMEDFNGSCVKREYNALGKLSKHIDQLERETQLYYDRMWNVERVIEPDGAETCYNYNHENKLKDVTKPDGSTLHYDYDLNGNLKVFCDEMDNRTCFSYDPLNRLTDMVDAEMGRTQFAYDAQGNIASVTDAMGNVTTFVYDNGGQLIQEINALGESRYYTYTSLGKVESIKDAGGLLTIYEYEKGGRLKSKVYADQTKESYTHDKVGNIAIYTDRAGQTKRYVYDGLNRVIKIIRATGAIKEYVYDAVSNVIAMIDELGNKTSYAYTLTGKLAKVIDALGNETHYIYDVCDRLIEEKRFAAGMDKDLLEVQALHEENQLYITRYERNIMGQITAVVDALGQKESFAYNLKGQLMERLDRDGFLTKYDYDGQGSLYNVKYADGKEVHLRYNPLRQLTKIKDWLGEVKIEVDPLGRAKKVTNHQGQKVAYTWGPLGEQRSITYPDGIVVDYDYDGLFRLHKVDDGINQTTYQYDAFSRLCGKSYGDDLLTKYLYNEDGLLQGLSHQNAM
ncbi:MAG: DUF6531 domain-containing protein, partial [Lachnospiraceae bacterium]|nr:DUF6531 domain-containing protein [Lachnospiraceae bacterium]